MSQNRAAVHSLALGEGAGRPTVCDSDQILGSTPSDTVIRLSPVQCSMSWNWMRRSDAASSNLQISRQSCSRIKQAYERGNGRAAAHATAHLKGLARQQQAMAALIEFGNASDDGPVRGGGAGRHRGPLEPDLTGGNTGRFASSCSWAGARAYR